MSSRRNVLELSAKQPSSTGNESRSRWPGSAAVKGSGRKTKASPSRSTERRVRGIAPTSCAGINTSPALPTSMITEISWNHCSHGQPQQARDWQRGKSNWIHGSIFLGRLTGPRHTLAPHSLDQRHDRWNAFIVIGNQQWPILRRYVERVVAAVHAATPGSFAEIDVPYR